MNLNRIPRAAAMCGLVWLATHGVTTSQAMAEPGLNNPAEVCASPVAKLDKFKHLRALSLELRGHPPSGEEYAELKELDDVPEAWIEAWLESPEFADRTVRWHHSLLWNNITGENLISASSRLSVSSGIYWRPGTIALRLRGRSIPCLNEPATFDAAGDPVMIEQPDGTRREGFVELEGPYWEPDTTIKACALDARDRLVAESGSPCGERATILDLSCGCGPNMRWCATGQTMRAVLESMGEQADRLVRDMVTERQSYMHLFESQDLDFNGPLAHYWRYQTQVPGTIYNHPAPLDTARLPDLAFNDRDGWERVHQGPHHAGILTTPAFLLRFQTDRARATQFYTKFLCQPFQPPPNGIQTNESAALESPDLQERDGCKYCHALLEPAAAYWGRWVERSSGYLDQASYPAFSAECETCARTGKQCSTVCRSYYMLDRSHDSMMPFSGYLSSYLWRADKHVDYIDQGPSLLARGGMTDGRLPRCIAQRSAESMLGRALTQREVDELVPELAAVFSDADYSYHELIKAIVTTPTYRSVR